jgi:hypothetical protein
MTSTRDTALTGAGISYRNWDEAQTEYRQRWQTRYGASGGRWEDFEPGYRYGHEMAHDTRFEGRGWPEAEPELRAGYRDWVRQRGYAQDEVNGWERFKENIRETWDEIRGRGYDRDDRRDEIGGRPLI